jgi:spermidine/putrescine transport system ATP-binding protein
MRDVIIKNIFKKYHNENILQDFSLVIPAKKLFAILGPSGCGKSTLLQIISGLESPDQGSIFLGDKNITNTPANKRKIHTVFQDYALFPHLNVYKNIAYSLEIRKLDTVFIRSEVEKIASSFSITNYLYKEITSLSGGQQQRVAIARAIINQPEVVLFDEPLSALDNQLKTKILQEIMLLQKEYNMTFIYVTHDKNEAMAIADNIAVIDEHGKLNQVGKPRDIYHNPQTAFVGKFFAETNQIKVSIEKIDETITTKSVQTGEKYSFLNKNFMNPQGIDNIHEGFLSIHKESFTMTKKAGSNNTGITLKGKISSIIYQGIYIEYFVETSEGTFRTIEYSLFSKEESPTYFSTNDTVYISCLIESILFLL